MMKISLRKCISTFLGIVLIIVLATPVFGASEVRVFVEYTPGSREAIRSELSKVGADVHYNFEKLNSFVVTVPQNSLNSLRKNSKIVAIEVDPVRELVPAIPSASMDVETLLTQQVVPYGVDMVQAREIWDVNADMLVDEGVPTGAGRKVCIIDTGLYTGHEDFAGVDVTGGYSQTNEDTALWTYDGYGHGTHVAGTIAAMPNAYGVVGVTPGTVSLFIVKIFGDDGLWVRKAHASDLIEAAYLCQDSGANIISMSLSGTTSSNKEEKAFNALYEAGILSIAAASNEGGTDYHYPASYDSVVSVAALDSLFTVADFSQYNDQVELAAPGVGVLSTIPYIDTTSVTVNGTGYSANHIEFSARGDASGALVYGGLCELPGSWAGKVVLCERGSYDFYTKVMSVQDGGGIAAVIYNNEPGNFLGTLGEGNSSTIVAVSISQEDGQYLVANSIDQIAMVSSVVEFSASGYEAWDGTSMSTPHVAAVSALIWSANPTWSNVQIREALAATAMDLGDTGRDVYYGFGLVQAKDALDYLLNH